MTVEAPKRTAWTDPRLDEFGKKVDERFDKVDEKFEKVDNELQALRGEVKAGFDRLMWWLLRSVGTIILMLLGLIGTLVKIHGL